MAITSCKKNSEPEVEVPVINLGKIQNHFVTLEQAKQVAILQSIYPTSTRKPISKTNIGKANSSVEPIVQKINPAKTVKDAVGFTGEGSEITFYIVNYQGGGFALISADDRTIPILAFSEKNEFPTDKTYPTALKLWLDAVHKGIQYKKKFNVKQSDIAKAEWKDLEIKSKLSQGSTNTINDYPECTEDGQIYIDGTTIGPLIGTAWHQREGFNDSIPLSQPYDIVTGPYTCYSNSTNGRPRTGCIILGRLIHLIGQQWGVAHLLRQLNY